MAKEAHPFIACLIAAELAQPAEVETLLQQLAAARRAAGEPGDVPDADLASKLIEIGRINRWQADQLLAGRHDFQLGPYNLIDSIGYGGMGQVYKAEHTIMGRVVAVKVLPRSKSTPEAIASFNREVRTQAQLDHENLVRAHDAGFDKQVHFLVTEYVPGTDLRKLVRAEGPLSMAAAASIMVQASKGLEYAHRRGLVHRDIKPGNMLVTPEGRTKVSDLGLAAYFEEDEVEDSRKNKVVGTADYIAPEQITNPGTANVASDLYSLGCTLYYAVTGKVPFPGGTHKEKWLAHRSKTPIHPRRLNPALSPEFCDVINRLMAKTPAERPASAAQVIELLTAWIDKSSPLVAHASVTGLLSGYEAQRGGSKSSGAAVATSTGPAFQVEPRPDPNTEESSGQTSQGTVKVASANEETLTHPHQHDDERFAIPMLLQVLVILGGVSLLLLLAATIAASL